MRFRTALSLAFIFVVCFTVVAWATPIPDRIVPARLAPIPDNQPEWGKTASAVRQEGRSDSFERGKIR